jgi:hypothetical protein
VLLVYDPLAGAERPIGRTRTQARLVAEAARAALGRDPASWWDLAARESHCPRAWREVDFGLQAGEVSPVRRSPFGFWVGVRTK